MKYFIFENNELVIHVVQNCYSGEQYTHSRIHKERKKRNITTHVHYMLMLSALCLSLFVCLVFVCLCFVCLLFVLGILFLSSMVVLYHTVRKGGSKSRSNNVELK